MADQRQTILVDKDLRPAYYDDFHCLMGACRYNCCDDPWDIYFEKGDYLKIKKTPKSPEMEELTRRCMHRLREETPGHLYAEFRNSGGEGHCAFHTAEGLCRLQLECGAETLPKVCREYPRSKTYLPSGYLERALSPSCEAVLELLWNLPEGVDFRSDPLPRTEWKNIRFQPGASSLSTRFSAVREWCIDRLQDRRFPLAQRVLLMGLGLRELAEGETDIDRWLERAALLPETVKPGEGLPGDGQSLRPFLYQHIRTLLSFDIEREGEFRRIRKELLTAMQMEMEAPEPSSSLRNVQISLGPYLAARERYETQLGERAYFMENLAVTVFYMFRFPDVGTPEGLWKSYVTFCSIYSFFRFLSVMSCREGVEDPKAELFRLISQGSRAMIHSPTRRDSLRDGFFQNDSATLAHMAVLLCG